MEPRGIGERNAHQILRDQWKAVADDLVVNHLFSTHNLANINRKSFRWATDAKAKATTVS